MAKVSIITVCLNSEKTIEKTIKSVLAQANVDVEYIIIDGGSTDETVNIIKQYEHVIDYWVSESDNGIYDAMNKGLSNVHGEIVGFINSGDWYEKNALRFVSDFFEKNDVDILSGGLYYCDEKGEVNRKAVYPQGDPWDKMAWGHPSLFSKKSVYDIIGYFDDSYRITADYKWLLTCYDKGVRFGYTEQALAYFTIGGISSTDIITASKEDYRTKKEVLSKSSLSEEQRKAYLSRAVVKLKISISKQVVGKNKKYDSELIERIPDVGKGIFLYGYGVWGKKIKTILERQDVKILGIADRGEIGKTVDFIDKRSLADLIKKTKKTILVCITNLDAVSEIRSEGISSNVIFLNDILIDIGKVILEKEGALIGE